MHTSEDCTVCVQCKHGFYKCKTCGRTNTSSAATQGGSTAQAGYTGIPNNANNGDNNTGADNNVGANSKADGAPLTGRVKSLHGYSPSRPE